jgi:4-amino-4-deoxychorismate lyase
LPLLAYHQQRVERTFKQYFPENEPLNLKELLSDLPTDGKYKCRIVYHHAIVSFEIQAYENPKIQSLTKVYAKELNYSFKFEDRQKLAVLYSKKQEADDIVIIQNKLVTDSYFANLAFFDGKEWWTSDTPLLAGVRRQFLIEHEKIKVSKIDEMDILNYKKISLINSMLDLGEVIIPISKVY